MKLKTVVFALIVTSCAGISMLEAQEVDRGTDKPVAKKRIGRPRPTTPNGGLIELANTGKVIQVVNLQAKCPAETFEYALQRLKKDFHFPIKRTADNLTGKRDEGVAARVVIVAKESAPVLLCALEDGWTELNVLPLMADNPDTETLKDRIDKELLRAVCSAFGCGYSAVQPSVMRDVRSLQELDSIARVMGPETKNMALGMARYRGCMFTKRVSYRTACKEGWAPAPTNDVQKAIWDEVHTLPTNPLPLVKPAK